MTNIVISGANGKMGRVINSVISAREDCRVIAGIDINTETYADFPIVTNPSELLEKPDVIIDFSHPLALDNLIGYALSTGTPLVLATTGYSDEQIAKIKSSSEQIPVFFTFNMSLGINLLVELAKQATSVLGNQFDIEIIEKHHNQKIDAPSGTAIMLADAINETLDNKMQYTYDRHSQRKKREKNEIGVHAVRRGNIVGIHEVLVSTDSQTITLKHEAHSRALFAEGAVSAAEFILGKDAGLYNMNSIVE